MFRASFAVRPLCALLVLAVLSKASFGADIPIPTPPTVDARAYIVVDYHTGKVLAARDADARMEPASLTKLMTAYIVFQELAGGKLKLTTGDRERACVALRRLAHVHRARQAGIGRDC